MEQFYLGSSDHDLINVGYASNSTSNNFLFDTSIIGSSNSGHEYGTGKYGQPAFTEQQRWALIEYLKTL